MGEKSWERVNGEGQMFGLYLLRFGNYFSHFLRARSSFRLGSVTFLSTFVVVIPHTVSHYI